MNQALEALEALEAAAFGATAWGAATFGAASWGAAVLAVVTRLRCNCRREALRLAVSRLSKEGKVLWKAPLPKTPEAKAAALAARPDPLRYARQMWQVISPSLSKDWTLDPAAWFLNFTRSLTITNADGSVAPAFTQENAAIRKAVATHHMQSPNLTPMCMALARNQDPGTLSILEKIQSSHPDTKVQGVAALAAALVIKSLGDDAEPMRKRLTHLRKAIIQSSDVKIGDTTVAQIAEDELYIIRNLTKGRIAPNLVGTDAASRPITLDSTKAKSPCSSSGTPKCPNPIAFSKSPTTR